MNPRTPMRHPAWTLLALALAVLDPSPGIAEADGPDYFRVVDVAANDVLNIRVAPGADHKKIGEIPADADGIRNLGCIGGLDFDAWSKASENERAEAAKTRWCMVAYGGVHGWVAGRYVGEGAAPTEPEGALWRIVAVDGAPAWGAAEIGFRRDGGAYGSTGCNRFQGGAVNDGGRLAFGPPLATTRMLCPGEEITRQEDRILRILEASPRLVFDPVSDRLTLETEDGGRMILERAGR